MFEIGGYVGIGIVLKRLYVALNGFTGDIIRVSAPSLKP